MIAVQIISLILFGTTVGIQIVLELLEMAGYWGIFRKCGAKPWKAVIPFYRNYVFAQCADREPEGRVIYIVEILMAAVSIWSLFTRENSTSWLIQTVCTFVLLIERMVIGVRIYMGLIEVFGRKKIWIILWILPVSCLVAIIWGWHRSFEPQWQIRDFEEEEANYFSGVHAQALANGLTININSRSIRNFFSKSYLLRDIHMYIKPGHMVLLLGGSGAGKTTFLNAVIGYEKADAEIVLNGGNVYKEYKKMKYQVGFVPQQDLMRGNDTVLRTLTDAAALRLPVDFDAGERRVRVDEVMKIFGLLPVRGHLVDKLSGGQRKRLSIAMEFISNPALFILDEPDSGLDGVMARELMEQLRSIADQGKIVIVITHTPDRVIDLFDDVIVLAKDTNRTGRLAFYGTIDEARGFFGKDRMEEIVMSVNREEEGGEGKADEYIMKYAQAQQG